jgi:hypothetical protein
MKIEGFGVSILYTHTKWAQKALHLLFLSLSVDFFLWFLRVVAERIRIKKTHDLK